MSNGKPETRFSFNPTALQFVFWSISKAIGLAVGIYVLGSWIASITFHRELEQFHRLAIPQIESRIDEHIRIHEYDISKILEPRLNLIEQNAVASKVRAQNLEERLMLQQRQLDRMEEKIDRILNARD